MSIFEAYSPSIRRWLFLCSFSFVIVARVAMCQGLIGVCNGRNGNNLPTEQQVVDLYKSNLITKMRIYDPNQATLTALRDSNIELMLDVPNDDLESLQNDATDWVRDNVQAYFPATKIKYIAVGNEVDPENPNTSRFVPFVLPAMKSIHTALTNFNLQDQIKVSTATYSALIQDPFPPSRASFKHATFMHPIVNYLVEIQSPLLANIYPYFAHKGNPAQVPLTYALFTAPGVSVQDDQNGYQNLFDAMVDNMYVALEKVGGEAENVEVVVSESGWPSEGGTAASVENAQTYYRNLIGHVSKGTPKRGGRGIQTYLFAMFDENLKPGEASEQHFGVFSVDGQNKYGLSFNN